jgi:hypothetical protein
VTLPPSSPRRWHEHAILILIVLLPAVIFVDQGLMLLGEKTRWTGDVVFDAANFAGALWDVLVYCPASIPLVIGVWRRRAWAAKLGLALYGGELAFCALTLGQVAYLMHRGYAPTGYQVALCTGLAVMIGGVLLTAGMAVYLGTRRW